MLLASLKQLPQIRATYAASFSDAVTANVSLSNAVMFF
jgi:hypothetical protein